MLKADFLDKFRFVLALLVVGDLVISPFAVMFLVLNHYEATNVALVTAQFAVVATQAGNILKDYFDAKETPNGGAAL